MCFATPDSWSLLDRLAARFREWVQRPIEYSFTDHWRAEGTIEQISNVLLDTGALSRWWPQLMAVDVLEWGGARGEQRTFRSRLKGFLPYQLQVGFQVEMVQFPHQFAVQLLGDLQGQGGGRLRQEGREVAIELYLTISATRPLLRVLSYLMRPLLEAQHNWVMRQGQQGLCREIARRQANVGAIAS